MKHFLALAILILCVFKSNAQNLIQNGDFELCNGDASCSTLPNNVSQFTYVANWSVAIPTPDWFDNTLFNNNDPSYGSGGYGSTVECHGTAVPSVRAQSGTHYVGIYDNEGIYYDMGENIQGPYLLTFWVQGCPSSSFGSSDNSSTWGAVVYGSPNPITNTGDLTDDGCGITPEHTELGRATFSESDYAGWHQVSITFFAYNGSGDNKVRYITITGYRDGGCGGKYMYLDNVDLEDYCCGDYMLYQDYDQLPPLTQRRDYIKAGYNVGCTFQPVGEVTVLANQNVIFQAPDVEATYAQGFNVVYPGVFTMQPGGCGIIYPTSNYDISLWGVDDWGTLNCNGDIIDGNAGFASLGASYYRVRIFNSSGGLIYEKRAFIHEIYTLFWDGSGTFTDNLGGEALIYLQLYNCSPIHHDSVYTYYYEYADDCSPDYKKSQTTDSISNATGKVFEVFPVPASNSLSIQFTSNGNNPIQFTIFNDLGQVVETIAYSTYPATGLINLDIKSFSSGIYLIQKSDSDVTETKKFIVSH